MTGHYPHKSFRMGNAGKLVKIAGHTFELGHEVEIFGAQTLAHTTGGNQLAENFGCYMTRDAGKRFQFEVMFGIEP